MARQAFHTLDGLRGLAAIAVVLIHMGMIFPLAWYPAGAYLAVDLFFGLSGFVMAEAYSARLDAGMPVSDFMRKRVLRLWPLYALGLTIGAATTASRVLIHYSPPSALTPYPLALLYIPWSGPKGELYPLNLPAWSLFYELAVNMAMAVGWRRLTNRALLVLVALSALGLIASAFAIGSLNGGLSWRGAPIAVSRVTFSFFLGILLWRVRLRSLKIAAPIPLIILAIGLTIDTTLLPRTVIDLLEVFLLFPSIILLGASTQPTEGSVALFGGVGGISYALYAVHEPLLQLTSSFIHNVLHVPVQAVPHWACMILLAGLILLAWVLNDLDVTLRGYLDRFIRWMTRRPAQILRSVPDQP
ncbi:acyltransferase [Gluconacetobacter azotocaptans]|uniref:Acyltransferase n=1 Tax=Gluconacetobacter azotocaptans TaxID=142834 RepID=A0A7W4PEP2_9PROT|nr:acyltransferase [Gluconacetobacter azotocaptans]MBB2191562.1 acyltransferase [Gluconacetobacter azotocaptans]MBM9403251.1 acyltransferase [Gluconacetobacter azotocaptans]GBQ26446.1 putative acyltransferase [Gluconacetobacter azotocaptans DSM 13594]